MTTKSPGLAAGPAGQRDQLHPLVLAPRHTDRPATGANAPGVRNPRVSVQMRDGIRENAPDLLTAVAVVNETPDRPHHAIQMHGAGIGGAIVERRRKKHTLRE